MEKLLKSSRKAVKLLKAVKKANENYEDGQEYVTAVEEFIQHAEKHLTVVDEVSANAKKLLKDLQEQRQNSIEEYFGWFTTLATIIWLLGRPEMEAMEQDFGG